jgi:hypothetical protein
MAKDELENKEGVEGKDDWIAVGKVGLVPNVVVRVMLPSILRKTRG